MQINVYTGREHTIRKVRINCESKNVRKVTQNWLLVGMAHGGAYNVRHGVKLE